MAIYDTLKEPAKRALGVAAAKMPWGAGRALLDALIQRFGARVAFVELGRKLRVESVCVRGRNGLIAGSLLDMNDAEDVGLLGRYAIEGGWSESSIDLFCGLFEGRGGAFIDIGANIGLTLAPIAKLPGVQCYGFEPEPRNYSYLTQNVAVNCPGASVELRQMAVFDRKAKLQLALSSSNFGDHRLKVTDVKDTSRATIEVDGDRLDSVIDASTLKRPLGVKIDTQGAEPGVFSGGEAVLALADLLTLEFWPFGMRRMGGDAEVVLRHLRAHFREGSIVRGDSSAMSAWRPIEQVVAERRPTCGP